MKKLTSLAWAVMAAAVIMICNLKPAQAEPPAVGGGSCVDVAAVGDRLRALCALPQYANCPTCAQFRPCMGGTSCSLGGGATAPVSWTYSQQCEENQPAVTGAHMEGNVCKCAEHYSTITVGNKSGASSSPNVHHNILIKRCVPLDRNETEIAAINAREAKRDELIKQLIEGEQYLYAVLRNHEGRLGALEADVAKMKADIETVKGQIFTASVDIANMKLAVGVIIRGINGLEADLKRVKEVMPQLELGARLSAHSRGSDAGGGTGYTAAIGWYQRFDGSNLGLSFSGYAGGLSCSMCDPTSSGRANVFHGGADVMLGYEFGQERGFFIRGGAGFSITSSSDKSNVKGAGRGIGPRAQIGYQIPGVPISISAVGGWDIYNRQDYYDFHGGVGNPELKMDSSQGYYGGLQLSVVTGLTWLGGGGSQDGPSK